MCRVDSILLFTTLVRTRLLANPRPRARPRFPGPTHAVLMHVVMTELHARDSDRPCAPALRRDRLSLPRSSGGALALGLLQAMPPPPSRFRTGGDCCSHDDGPSATPVAVGRERMLSSASCKAPRSCVGVDNPLTCKLLLVRDLPEGATWSCQVDISIRVPLSAPAPTGHFR